MGNNEIYWGIFSGKVLLPFTVRSTRGQCISDRQKYLNSKIEGTTIHGVYFDAFMGNKLLKDESCRKIVINEWIDVKGKF